jgi:hypothetical protein
MDAIEKIEKLKTMRDEIDRQLQELGANEPKQSDFNDIVNLRKSDFRNYQKDD